MGTGPRSNRSDTQGTRGARSDLDEPPVNRGWRPSSQSDGLSPPGTLETMARTWRPGWWLLVAKGSTGPHRLCDASPCPGGAPRGSWGGTGTRSSRQKWAAPRPWPGPAPWALVPTGPPCGMLSMLPHPAWAWCHQLQRAISSCPAPPACVTGTHVLCAAAQ